MAKKVVLPHDQQAAEHNDDLSVLSPDQTVNIGGEAVVVSEYRFLEGLALISEAQPLLGDLEGAMTSGECEVENVLHILNKHQRITLKMVAVATGKDESEIEQLSAADGHRLLQQTWAVNGPFFMRTVLEKSIGKMLVQVRGGPMPYSCSSAMGTPQTA